MPPQKSSSANASDLRPAVVARALLAALGLLAVTALVSHALRPAPQSQVHPGPPGADPRTSDARPPLAPSAAAAMPGPESAASPLLSGHNAGNALARKTDRERSPALAMPAIPKSRSVQEQILALNNLVIGDLPANEKLEVAVAALESRERKVRVSALEAVLELDDRAAIPRLQELAARTDDPDERQALLNAADHLALPSLSEYLAERRASGQAGPPSPAGPVPRVGRISRK